MIDIVSYWPFSLKGTTERRRFDYSSADGSLEPISSVFWWDAKEDALIYSDYDAAGVWKDDWFLRFIPGYGVAEYADEYPQTGWLAKIFGPRRKLAFADKQWIGWGDSATIGEMYGTVATVNPWQSSPPQFGSCKQAVLFEAHLDEFGTRHGDLFKDVLVFSYLQQWKDKCYGGRYWMARGVGPVAIQWLGVNPEDKKWLGVDHSRIYMIKTARIDAKVTTESMVA